MWGILLLKLKVFIVFIIEILINLESFSVDISFLEGFRFLFVFDVKDEIFRDKKIFFFLKVG